LELLKETGLMNESEFCSMNNDAKEILKIIRSIILTTKQKSNYSLLNIHNSET